MKSLPIKQSVLLIMVIPFLGCASLTDWKYEKTQRHRALAAYRACGKCAADRCYPKDYKLGFLDGYYDALTGNGCCPPAIAPSRYWKPNQILKDCDRRRHAYYSGWQDGAASASQCPDTHYLRVFETCECPMPRCEQQCCDPDCCPTQPACQFDGLGIQDGNQMIEILSDEPIGTASGSMYEHDLYETEPEPIQEAQGGFEDIPEDDLPAEEIMPSGSEVDLEYVPESSEAEELPESDYSDVRNEAAVRPVGFVSPAKSDEIASPEQKKQVHDIVDSSDAKSLPEDEAVTPEDLFQAWK